MMESVQEYIEKTLSENFNATYLQVINESHQHNVPAHSETHFKVILVTDDFQGYPP
ncbi:MAG: BolA/IbaG family iron-sulfur metabolism protein [Bdellovibrionales bacterium]